MKKTDIKILTQLRINGRIRLTELSSIARLPVSTIHDRLKTQMKQGALRPTVLIDFEKIGFRAKAHILISVETAEKEKLALYLKAHANVNSLYRINNGWNILMECVFKDMYSLETFLDELENKFQIKQKQVNYVMDELKREGFMTDIEQAEKLFAPNN